MDHPNLDHAKAGERINGLQKQGLVYGQRRHRRHDLVAFNRIFSFNMLNEVNVKVRLVRNKDTFCLMSGEANSTYKVKLIGAVLIVSKAQLSPSGFLDDAKALESEMSIIQSQFGMRRSYKV